MLHIEYFGNEQLQAIDNPYVSELRGCYSITASNTRATGVAKMTYSMVEEVVIGLQTVLEAAGNSYEATYSLEDAVIAGNVYGKGALYKRRPRNPDEISSS